MTLKQLNIWWDINIINLTVSTDFVRVEQHEDVAFSLGLGPLIIVVFIFLFKVRILVESIN